MLLGEYKTQRQITIGRSMDQVLAKLVKQQTKLEDIVKEYGIGRKNKAKELGEDFDKKVRKKGRSLDVKQKKNKAEKNGEKQKNVIKLPSLSIKPQLLTPKHRTKEISNSSREQQKSDFLMKSYSQRQAISTRHIKRNKQQSQPVITQFQQHQSLHDYFNNFRQIISKQVQQQINHLSTSNNKQTLILLLQQHDRQISKLRRKCHHLERFDTSFFTSDMYNEQ